MANGYKAILKACQTSEMETFRKLLPTTKTNLESCQTFMIELLCFYRL